MKTYPTAAETRPSRGVSALLVAVGAIACACGAPAVRGDDPAEGMGGSGARAGGAGSSGGPSSPGGAAGSSGSGGAAGGGSVTDAGSRSPGAGGGAPPDAGRAGDTTGAATGPGPAAPDGGPTYPAAKGNIHVSPTGTDTNDGRSPERPLKTLQRALTLAMPGDAINLAPGTYAGDFTTVRAGEAAAPIVIKGPPTAILKGARRDHLFDVHHSHIIFDGFTIDGLRGDPKTAGGWNDTLIYVLGKSPKSGPTGVRILRMTLKNAGGECVRFRYFCTKNEVAHSTITTCGAHDYQLNGGGKNGEGVYIGTAPEQLGDGKAPTRDPDESNDNWIHDNVIDTKANECVDIKESATRNIIERNKCTGQKDPESAGLDARGSGNVFRGNETYGNVGAGVRLGGDGASDGINNDVYDNYIHDNMNGAISIQRMPQGRICGNRLANNGVKDVRGVGGAAFKPADPCP